MRAGARVGTEIGVATTNSIGLTWEDDDSLVVSVPPGMDKAFDRDLQGVQLKFEVVTDVAELTPNKTMEPTRRSPDSQRRSAVARGSFAAVGATYAIHVYSLNGSPGNCLAPAGKYSCVTERDARAYELHGYSVPEYDATGTS